MSALQKRGIVELTFTEHLVPGTSLSMVYELIHLPHFTTVLDDSLREAE